MHPKRRIKLVITVIIVLLLALAASLLLVRCHAVSVPAGLRQHAYGTKVYERLLRSCVDDGLVDYQKLDSSYDGDLDVYLDVIARFGPTSTPNAFQSDAESLAFYLNAYNAIMLKQWLLADAAGRAPDRKMNLMWFFTSFWRVDGHWMSLDHLEQDIIRPRFNEPRIHMALVCGAMSCPPLLDEPFDANMLDEQLEHLARRWLMEDDGLRVGDDGRVEMSSIFKWYEDDFAPLGGLAGVLERYVPASDPRRQVAIEGATAGEIDFMPYDWTMNDVRNGDPARK